MEMLLSGRRAEVLGLLVDEYIESAAPVSSKALVDRYALNVSAATVRNEFAALELDGYITHPYTSAGRVPSDRGYRFYVETLMAEQPLPPQERRTVEHQFHQASRGLDEWLTLAAALLASWVGNAAVVTRPRARVSRLRHMQLVHLRDDSALLVAVMDDGRVQQRIISLRAPATQQELNAMAERLNVRCAGHEADVARAVAADLTDADERAAAETVGELIDEHRLSADTYLDGLQAVLEQPEFASQDRMLEAVRHLAVYELQRVLAAAAGVRPGSTRVLIGSENEDAWMQEWSVIATSYGRSDGPEGTVVVLGPTRMHYARIIPRVKYLATLMSNLIPEPGA